MGTDSSDQQKDFVSVQYGSAGSAATIDSDGNLDMYACEMGLKFSSCKQTNPLSVSIKEKYDRILEDSAFGTQNIQAYAFTKKISQTTGKSIVCYQARVNTSKKINCIEFDLLAESIAFQVDQN
mgnify:CR=1 FL=1